MLPPQPYFPTIPQQAPSQQVNDSTTKTTNNKSQPSVSSLFQQKNKVNPLNYNDKNVNPLNYGNAKINLIDNIGDVVYQMDRLKPFIKAFEMVDTDGTNNLLISNINSLYSELGNIKVLGQARDLIINILERFNVLMMKTMILKPNAQYKKVEDIPKDDTLFYYIAMIKNTLDFSYTLETIISKCIELLNFNLHIDNRSSSDFSIQALENTFRNVNLTDSPPLYIFFTEQLDKLPPSQVRDDLMKIRDARSKMPNENPNWLIDVINSLITRYGLAFPPRIREYIINHMLSHITNYSKALTAYIRTNPTDTYTLNTAINQFGFKPELEELETIPRSQYDKDLIKYTGVPSVYGRTARAVGTALQPIKNVSTALASFTRNNPKEAVTMGVSLLGAAGKLRSMLSDNFLSNYFRHDFKKATSKAVTKYLVKKGLGNTYLTNNIADYILQSGLDYGFDTMDAITKFLEKTLENNNMTFADLERIAQQRAIEETQQRFPKIGPAHFTITEIESIPNEITPPIYSSGLVWEELFEDDEFEDPENPLSTLSYTALDGFTHRGQDAIDRYKDDVEIQKRFKDDKISDIIKENHTQILTNILTKMPKPDSGESVLKDAWETSKAAANLGSLYESINEFEEKPETEFISEDNKVYVTKQ
ncbi:TPA_asm: hypothetical protein [Anelosimus tangle-web spider MELD virus]|nr:TPA_asm: hypothetical protein [Anelosimus tangle-web spider MELD virus]